MIFPPQERIDLLNELHNTHPAGFMRMKALARSYVWRPGLDKELCKQCTHCQSQRKLPPKSPLHLWEYPKQPCSRLHIDFAGPKYG